MSMTFQELASKLRSKFLEMTNAGNVLYEADVNKDMLWDTYLGSFPEGTNPIYRKRRYFDCSCCKSFIRKIGGTVFIDDDYNAVSIFRDILQSKDDTFTPVMNALADYVESRPITGKFMTRERSVGQFNSRELDGSNVKTYYHFQLDIPKTMLVTGGTSIGKLNNDFVSTKNVFKRSLNEIKPEALDIVFELINTNTLYKGEEWKRPLEEFKKYQDIYFGIDPKKRDNWCWKNSEKAGSIVGRIRNHSIGVLLTDISEGMDLDQAVRRYEAIVAPANYKRPKAIFTKKMLEDAKKTVEELGFGDSLERRFATLNDISINNILFSNKDSAKRMIGGASIFDDMAKDIEHVDPKKFSRVEEITAEKFVTDVLPTAREVEALVENWHEPNFVSLIAPVNPDAKSMFKWNNAFSWAYHGNMTDSDIRENVKKAGGNINAFLRFSIQWNDLGNWDQNDLDAHCFEKLLSMLETNHIYYYSNKSWTTGGFLDVDIVNPVEGVPAVENIAYADKRNLEPGQYMFCVNCYSYRGGNSGFRAEIELDGKTYNYDRSTPMQQGETDVVAIVTVDEKRNVTIEHKMKSETGSRKIWGVKTSNFIPVSTIMYSPNYWDDQNGIGHRHYFFMLKGCVNPEHPNGFYNEYLKNELMPHKRVFEALGSRMAVQDTEDQLSGLGFSATKRSNLVVKVKGSSERIMKIVF